jgi:hypothetical protein
MCCSPVNWEGVAPLKIHAPVPGTLDILWLHFSNSLVHTCQDICGLHDFTTRGYREYMLIEEEERETFDVT